MSLVRTDVHAGVATVTLSDPERRNALTMPMVTEIIAAFDALEADPDVGAVVVTGRGTGVLRRGRPVPPVLVVGGRRGDRGCATSTRGSCGSAALRCPPSRRSTAPRSAPA